MPAAVPIDPAKLVEAAREFAEHQSGAGRPKSIWLRRAVSSAYYALFHCVCRQAAEYLLPNASLPAQLRLARSFGHRDLKRGCAWIAGRDSNVHQYVQPLVTSLQSSPIRDVAESFCDLLEERHRADYDHLAAFSKATAVADVNDAERSIQTLASANQHDRQAFFSVLAIVARGV